MARPRATAGHAGCGRHRRERARSSGRTARQYLAAFAYLLGRVADADHAISAEERELMLRLVAKEGSLSPAETEAVVTLALDQFPPLRRHAQPDRGA